MTKTIDRRGFLRFVGSGTTLALLSPLATACSSDSATPAAQSTTGDESRDPLAVPMAKPSGWDPIDFNRRRGHAGAIPESYWPSIDGPDGVTDHLGKHLPYVAEQNGFVVPAGMIALMWGDPSKGYAKHPNAVPNDSNNNEGHWYNWIEIRKATDVEARLARSEYPAWPGEGFAVEGGGQLKDDAGKNTVYLAALPDDVLPGDLVRVQAHCLTHGEYVDFVVVPG